MGLHPGWVGNTSGPALMWTLCSQLVNRMHIQFLPVYTPSAAEVASPHLYASNVRSYMAEAMDVPCTQHSFDDVRLQAHAMRHGYSSDESVVEMELVKKLFSVDFATVKKHLDAFAAIDTDHSGRISYDEFRAAFGVADSPELLRLFMLLDTDQSGGLEFRQYLLGLALLNENDSGRRGVIKLAFKAFDADDDGLLSEPELFGFLARSGHSDVDVARAFAEADKNRDGKLSFEEFLSYVESHEDVLEVFTSAFASWTAASADASEKRDQKKE